MENVNIAEQEDIIFAQHKIRAKEIRDEILASYKHMVENIRQIKLFRIKSQILNIRSFLCSDSNLAEVNELLEEETGRQLELNKAIAIFKANLYEEIERKFIENWNNAHVDTNIAILEFSKAKCANDERKWRPTNQTTEEQIRPIVYKNLRKRQKFLQHQITFQNTMIEQLIFNVEEYRRQLRNQSEKRQRMVDLMEADEEKLKTTDEEIGKTKQVQKP